MVPKFQGLKGPKKVWNLQQWPISLFIPSQNYSFRDIESTYTTVKDFFFLVLWWFLQNWKRLAKKIRKCLY